jgi:hypothetical protein
MARERNHISTVQITISTTPPLKKLLERLVTTGLYGKSAAEAAERLVAREIERLMGSGVLPK